MPVIAAHILIARPLARTIKWPAIVASFVPALGIVWYVSNDQYANVGTAALSLRLAALSLAVAIAFVLDDPTEDLTGPAPVSLLARRVVRVALALPVVILFWIVLVAMANGASFMTQTLSQTTMLVELFAFISLAVGGAAIGGRHLADKLGGPAGAGIVVCVVAVGGLLPWGRSLLAQVPGTAAYTQLRSWWWVAIAAGALAFVMFSATPGWLRTRWPTTVRRSLTPTP
jgi:fluoroquinolone transport system permease protein